MARWDSWDEHVEWLVDKKESGWSIQDIADEAGLGYQQVYRRLRDAGADTSSDYTKPGPDNPMYDPEAHRTPPLHERRVGVPERFEEWDAYLSWLGDEYESGKSTNDLADELGVAPATVRERLEEAGVERRRDHMLPGPDNPRYDGGDESREWRTRSRWRKLRLEVFDRDGWECWFCWFATDSTSLLNAHHVEPVSEGGAKYDRANIVTLCRWCHRAVHDVS